MVQITKLPNQFFIKIISVYRYFISPLIGSHCRFHPSCSEYAITSLQKLNLIQATVLIIWRLLRCNPYHRGGYDPVPTTAKKI